MDRPSSFGAWLRRLRSELDLTQEALAERAGCAVQTLRAIERGRRRASREMAERLAQVLGLPPEEREAFLRLARRPLSEAATTVDDEPPSTSLPSLSPLHPPLARLRLPVPPTPLIGRQAELAHIRQLLEGEARLVTILGPGGIGKTRLALQVAADQAGAAVAQRRFADGVVFVALAALSDAGLVAPAIADALGYSLPGALPAEKALGELLRKQSLLLVLDNLEQLLAPAHNSRLIDLLSSLLDQAPDLALLATSRERLRLQAEWAIELEGLSLPANERAGTVEHSPAALLFLERARRLTGDFSLSADNRGAVAEISRLLGGMPLALELAAAWTPTLSPAEIAAEIRQGLAFLSLGDRNAAPRHRSLRAVMDHSWQLLNSREQRLLARCSLFRGGFSREAALAVAGEADETALGMLQLLKALIDKSLLRQDRGPGGATRYDLHELVRQYAAERLAEDPTVAAAARARHADYYAGWVEQQDEILKSARQKEALQAISAEIDNLRAAWDWAVAGQASGLLLQMLLTLGWFHEIRGWGRSFAAMLAAAVAAFRPAVEAGRASEEQQLLYWLALSQEGWASVRYDPQGAAVKFALALEPLRRLDNGKARFHGAITYAYLLGFAGDYAAADQLIEEAAAVSRHCTYAWGEAVAFAIRVTLEALRENHQLVRNRLAEGLKLARTVGDPRLLNTTLVTVGLLEVNLGRLEQAAELFNETLQLSAAQGDRFETCRSLWGLGLVAGRRDQWDRAERLFHESLAIAHEISDRWMETENLTALGRIAAARGQEEVARRFLRAALQSAAAAPAIIALEALAALAELELSATPPPPAALTALAYLRRQPLLRSATRATIEQRWQTLAARLDNDTLAAAEAAAHARAAEPPAALVDGM